MVRAAGRVFSARRARLANRKRIEPVGAPIPLRADPLLLRERERRSFNRAAAALVLAHGRGERPQSVLKQNWGDDDQAALILRVAMNPTTTQDFAQIQTTKFLEMLAPTAAG